MKREAGALSSITRCMEHRRLGAPARHADAVQWGGGYGLQAGQVPDLLHQHFRLEGGELGETGAEIGRRPPNEGECNLFRAIATHGGLAPADSWMLGRLNQLTGARQPFFLVGPWGPSRTVGEKDRWHFAHGKTPPISVVVVLLLP